MPDPQLLRKNIRLETIPRRKSLALTLPSQFRLPANFWSSIIRLEILQLQWDPPGQSSAVPRAYLPQNQLPHEIILVAAAARTFEQPVQTARTSFVQSARCGSPPITVPISSIHPPCRKSSTTTALER